MAYTFLKAEGFTVGKSLVEDAMMPTALEIKKRAEEKGIEFLLPTDHQVVDSYEPIKGRKDRRQDDPDRVYEYRSCRHGYRRRDGRAFLGGASGCANDYLEWSDGRV